MKKYVIVAFGLLGAQPVFAQEETQPVAENKYLKYNYSVKLYNEASYHETQNPGYGGGIQGLHNLTNGLSHFFRPTIAMQWRNKRHNFHEVELNRLNVSKEHNEERIYASNGQYTLLGAGNIINTDISFRYEYIIQFFKRKNTRLVPSLGLGINPYYSRQNFKPESSAAIPEMHVEHGMRTFVTPRLSYYFSNKFYLDANLPFCITNTSVQADKIMDPALSKNQQKYSIVNAELFPKLWSARIGLGMKI